METKVKIREWGSSLGVVIPIETVRKEALKPGDEILIDIKKTPTLRDIFGSLKGLKIDSQAMKDESRKEDAKQDEKLWRLINKVPRNLK